MHGAEHGGEVRVGSEGGASRALHLVHVIQQLSLARDLPRVMAIVRRAARELTGADGATFVLRDGERCFYADEDAIAPLWKGRRFPIEACISGWVMLHREPTVIEDIYADPRIPADAYRPTFVRSLAMVPIRTSAPIGAIGNYWATPHRPTAEDVTLLQALADSTSIAMENVQLYADLEHRVRDRTAALEAANAELEAFSYSVSHDLKSPLRAIGGFSRLLLEGNPDLDATAQEHLSRVASAATRMAQLIDDLLRLARIGRTELRREHVDVTAIAHAVVTELAEHDPDRRVRVTVADDMTAEGDAGLLRIVLENLIRNAWKFTARTADATIEVGRAERAGQIAYYVRDNGAGFDPTYAAKLFVPFERLHSEQQFAGTGIGLATVQRIVRQHRGQVSAEGAVGRGATFYFTIPTAA